MRVCAKCGERIDPVSCVIDDGVWFCNRCHDGKTFLTKTERAFADLRLAWADLLDDLSIGLHDVATKIRKRDRCREEGAE